MTSTIVFGCCATLLAACLAGLSYLLYLAVMDDPYKDLRK